MSNLEFDYLDFLIWDSNGKPFIILYTPSTHMVTLLRKRNVEAVRSLIIPIEDLRKVVIEATPHNSQSELRSPISLDILRCGKDYECSEPNTCILVRELLLFIETLDDVQKSLGIT